jgi:hypothetical protein
MRRLLLWVFLFAAAVLFFSGSQSLAYNTQITVYASVPMMRVIYVDESGNITKVLGNTTQNIDPKVYDEHNQLISMTSQIQDQYNKFLKAHGGHLEASKIYVVNPIKVSNQPISQTIDISAASQSLTLSL